jgi:hypothetical protein
MQGVKTDLTGQRFGKLIVLELALGHKRDRMWQVQCDCGSPVKFVSTANLLRANRGVRSCGCLTRREKGEAARNRVLHDYKKNAKKRGLVWGLSDSQFIQLTSRGCHYCGRAPSNVAYPSESSNGNFTYNGIDRIDNGLGYVEGNVVTCCKTCNWAKGEQSHDEFMSWVASLFQYQLQKQTTNILVREQVAAAAAAA